MQNKIQAIGLMSGTSLDGLDIAFCEFWQENEQWKYQFLKTESLSYPQEWQENLSLAQNLLAQDFLLLNNAYGRYIGEQTKLFIKTLSIRPQIIASHGHTVFHQPQNNFTFQLGNPAEIAAQTGITTIANFRSLDIALGGQGAPLVPIGDKLLFSDYDICLNLGGFANISLQSKGKRIAYDVCAVNFVLNYFAHLINQIYDNNGDIGRHGEVNKAILEELNQLAFYKQRFPKSLAREWVEKVIFPVFNAYKISVSDMFRTYYEHIAYVLSTELNLYSPKKILITGGGVYNQFLIELLTKKLDADIIIPHEQLIDFKEALIFAFLGVLRLENQNNCLKSVTGASADNSGGVIYG